MEVFTRQFKAYFMRGVKKVNDICGYLIYPIFLFLIIEIWIKYPEHHGTFINLGALAVLIFVISVVVFMPLYVMIFVVAICTTAISYMKTFFHIKYK